MFYAYKYFTGLWLTRKNVAFNNSKIHTIYYNSAVVTVYLIISTHVIIQRRGHYLALLPNKQSITQNNKNLL